MTDEEKAQAYDQLIAVLRTNTSYSKVNRKNPLRELLDILRENKRLRQDNKLLLHKAKLAKSIKALCSDLRLLNSLEDDDRTELDKRLRERVARLSEYDLD